jgi:hypothetical protein
MTRTVQVTAQLFQATRRMTVEPGQYVMVVADMVVGVYTGDKAVPVQHRVPTHEGPFASKREADETSVAKDSKKEVTKRTLQRRHTGASGGIRINGQPVATLIPVIHHIVEALRTRDEVTSLELKETIPTELDPTGWRLRDSARWLRDNEIVTPVGHTLKRSYTKGPKFPESGQLEFPT